MVGILDAYRLGDDMVYKLIFAFVVPSVWNGPLFIYKWFNFIRFRSLQIRTPERYIFFSLFQKMKLPNLNEVINAILKYSYSTKDHFPYHLFNILLPLAWLWEKFWNFNEQIIILCFLIFSFLYMNFFHFCTHSTTHWSNLALSPVFKRMTWLFVWEVVWESRQTDILTKSINTVQRVWK